MRISCTGFARLQDPSGRFALLVNAGRLKRGHGRLLSPIGGAFDAQPDEIEHISRTLGAYDFEQGSDLRFRVDDARVEDVVEWFGRREQRETTVLRELTEELVDETRILQARDLHTVREAFRRFVRYDSVTIRDVPEKRTAYLIETFDVRIPRGAMRKLLSASAVEQPHIYFAHADEIRRCEMDDGTKIGEITKKILA
ncbi:MAG TPA: hypothetical protein VLG36_04460 [Candidatus Chromulinivoraceae bacterium]|nr:hypothetical protein [Candidatus Chromulinivoraceae bacterium]